MARVVALGSAAGLRINQDALALSDAVFDSRSDTPGFFGVKVAGEAWAGEGKTMVEDHPGLPGLEVQVEVVHNSTMLLVNLGVVIHLMIIEKVVM